MTSIVIVMVLIVVVALALPPLPSVTVTVNCTFPGCIGAVHGVCRAVALVSDLAAAVH